MKEVTEVTTISCVNDKLCILNVKANAGWVTDMIMYNWVKKY